MTRESKKSAKKPQHKPEKRPVGRPRAISSPEEFESHFIAYKTWTKENPYRVHDFVGKDAIEVRREKERPLTWKGFEVFLNKTGVVSDYGHYEKLSEFSPIIRACRAQCSQDIIEGALAGVYQQNIAARLEGLKEQTDLTTNGKEISPVITAMVDGKIVNGELK